MRWDLRELAEEAFIMYSFWSPAVWAKIKKKKKKKKSEIRVAATVANLPCAFGDSVRR